MTPFFISEFKKTVKCKQCKAGSARNRKFCHYHLRIAREKFQTWSIQRRAAERCISCNRKSFKNGECVELRCRLHKAINRTRCNAYTVAVNALTRQTGICHQCSAGNKVIPNTLWCMECRQRGYIRGKAWRAKQKEANGT